MFIKACGPLGNMTLLCCMSRIRTVAFSSGVGIRQHFLRSGRCRLSSAAPAEGPPPPPVKESLFTRFKAMYRDYWYVLVPVHVSTSIVWIGGFYYFAKSGVDLGYYMKKVGISENVVDKVTHSGAGHLAVAYALYKIATPARYAVTLGGTTLAINSLRNMGYLTAREIMNKNKDKFLKKFPKT